MITEALRAISGLRATGVAIIPQSLPCTNHAKSNVNGLNTCGKYVTLCGPNVTASPSNYTDYKTSPSHRIVYPRTVNHIKDLALVHGLFSSTQHEHN